MNFYFVKHFLISTRRYLKTTSRQKHAIWDVASKLTWPYNIRDNMWHHGLIIQIVCLLNVNGRKRGVSVLKWQALGRYVCQILLCKKRHAMRTYCWEIPIIFFIRLQYTGLCSLNTYKHIIYNPLLKICRFLRLLLTECRMTSPITTRDFWVYQDLPTKRPILKPWTLSWSRQVYSSVPASVFHLGWVGTTMFEMSNEELAR